MAELPANPQNNPGIPPLIPDYADPSHPAPSATPPPTPPSLDRIHSPLPPPPHTAILVSVGYMDPGNWGTDLAAGAQFKYALLWVVALASLMAIFMQVLSARLG